MPKKILSIPTVNDSVADFEPLFSLWSQVNDYFEDVQFDFSGCRFLRPDAAAFLGGLARLIESRLGTAAFDWNTLRDDAVMKNNWQNRFAVLLSRIGFITPSFCGDDTINTIYCIFDRSHDQTSYMIWWR